MALLMEECHDKITTVLFWDITLSCKQWLLPFFAFLIVLEIDNIFKTDFNSCGEFQAKISLFALSMTLRGSGCTPVVNSDLCVFSSVFRSP